MAGPDPSRHLYTEQPPHTGGGGDGQRPMGAPPTRAATAPNTVSSASAEAVTNPASRAAGASAA